MGADAIFQLKTIGLCQDNGNEDILVTTENVVENIIEEVYLADAIQKATMYNTEKLNLDILRKKEQCD